LWPIESGFEQHVLSIIRNNDGHYRRYVVEATAVFAWRLFLCWLNWRCFAFFFLPAAFLINRIHRLDDIVQHRGATDPDDPLRNSVSCYGRVYNWLTFNLGHHQEHHWRPGVHWSSLPLLREDLPTARRIVPVSLYLNLPLFTPLKK
jgi:fatty acid desaturase